MALVLPSGSRIGHFEEQIVWKCILNVFLRKGLSFILNFYIKYHESLFGHQLLLYTAHRWAYGKSIGRHFIEWCISQDFTRTSRVENHWYQVFPSWGPSLAQVWPAIVRITDWELCLSSASSSNTELLFQIISGWCCHFTTYATCLHTPWLFKKSFEVKSAKAIANMELIKSIYA